MGTQLPRFRSSPIRQKGAQQPPTFRPMSTVAKRSPISATAELLLLFVKDALGQLQLNKDDDEEQLDLPLCARHGSRLAPQYA